MRWLFVMLVACAVVAPACAENWRVDRVSTTDRIDPETGARITTTTTVRSTVEPGSYRWSTPYMGAPVVVGAPVVAAPHSFPLNPVDDQEVWINGVKYEYDAEDGEWEVDD